MRRRCSWLPPYFPAGAGLHPPVCSLQRYRFGFGTASPHTGRFHRTKTTALWGYHLPAIFRTAAGYHRTQIYAAARLAESDFKIYRSILYTPIGKTGIRLPYKQ